MLGFAEWGVSVGPVPEAGVHAEGLRRRSLRSHFLRDAGFQRRLNTLEEFCARVGLVTPGPCVIEEGGDDRPRDVKLEV